MGFKVPANAQVQRQSLRQAPIVLQVCANLLVVLFEAGIAELPIELIGVSKLESQNARAPLHGVRKEEVRRLVVALDDVVRQQIDSRAQLEDVIAAGVESGVGDVVPKAEPLLRKILDA